MLLSLFTVFLYLCTACCPDIILTAFSSFTWYAGVDIFSCVFNTPFIFCSEELVGLPIAAQFENLDQTDNFAAAVKVLRGLAGVYCIKNVLTGAMYIGSSVNLGKRMNEHFLSSTNIHLQNAMVQYGIAAFIFIVVEWVEIIPGMASEEIKVLLLSREQIFGLAVLSSFGVPLQFA